MPSLLNLLRKTIPYYKFIGFKEFVYAFMYEVLFWVEGKYRSLYWKRIRKKFKNNKLMCSVDNFNLYLNGKDKGLSVELFLYGMHEPFLSALLKKIILKDMVVVDIGANIGYFPLIEYNIVGERGKVIAIEPFPDSYNLLQENIKFNNALNFITKNFAISDKNGTDTMYSFEMANWNSLLHKNRHFSASFEVQTITLDRLVESEPKVDAIRMDIEGYECKVIDGMVKTLSKHKPLLIVELHGGLVTYQEISEFLKKIQNIDYEIKYIFPRKRDEIFFGFQLFNEKNVFEKLSISELLNDPRLIKLHENFTIVFSPKN